MNTRTYRINFAVEMNPIEENYARRQAVALGLDYPNQPGKRRTTPHQLVQRLITEFGMSAVDRIREMSLQPPVIGLHQESEGAA